jgi:predicted AlkP superfamily phosphohydrolase/phosphomutase
MAARRVLALGLDGIEIALAEQYMAAGDMPELAALARRSARFRLDHGPAQRTGLAWEHVASGLSPEDGRRWSAVEFDPCTYDVWQEGARFTPWWAGLDRRVVVFDTPYVDLRRAPATRGVVGWGMHDPGVATSARPLELLPEFEDRFGAYPKEWTYGMPFPSSERTRAMGEALSRAVAVRSRASRWLAIERLPDWDLFIAVAGEAHGATEGLWHGVDPEHPRYGHPSAKEACRALADVYRALDRMVGELTSVAGDAAVVVFTMGGMGPNLSDVPSMVLLPELLYRRAFGERLLAVPPEWTGAPDGLPALSGEERWSKASRAWIPGIPEEPPSDFSKELRALARRLPKPAQSALREIRSSWSGRSQPVRKTQPAQPSLHYRHEWPRMPAFALPSFYDGRIRINLKGRERHGLVEPSRYEETCRELETMLHECRNPRTGEPIVGHIERPWTRDPLALTGSEADLVIVWRGIAAALEHPRLGLIGPVPLRRSGGHTGPHGMAYLAGTPLEPGDRGLRSSFDVVPTIARLLEAEPRAPMSGASIV